MRSFLAALAGIVSGGVAIWTFESLGHMIFPVDLAALGIDRSNLGELRNIMYKIPTENLISVVLAHGLGLLVGLFIARLIERKSLGPLFGVSGMLFLMTLINILLIPHPAWFMFADLGVILILSFAFIATRKKA